MPFSYFYRLFSSRICGCSPNYVILEDDSVHELKVPSGYQSGVKIVKGFTINENGTTEIILDFDAMSSVVEAGNSGQWLLKLKETQF